MPSRTYRNGQVKRFLLGYENKALTRKQTSFMVSVQCYFQQHFQKFDVCFGLITPYYPDEGG